MAACADPVIDWVYPQSNGFLGATCVTSDAMLFWRYQGQDMEWQGPYIQYMDVQLAPYTAVEVVALKDGLDESNVVTGTV